ncbi:MAG: DNA polymerase I [Hyphomonadaceae bacterium]
MPDSASAAPQLDSQSRLYLVDGSGYIFRAYHALPPLTRPSDGLPVGAVSGFCNMLWKFLEDVKGPEKPTHLAIVFDKSEQTFRKDIYPKYKAQRPPAPEDLVPQFPLVREAARAFGISVVELDGFEADDLIATYARLAARAGAKVNIVSSDKDLMQLVEDGIIHLFDPMKQKPIGPAEVMEKFGVGPDKVIDVQALMGDSTDNVPGCPGIGQKTAAELITAYGDIETLLARAGEIKQPKRREALIANADLIRVSKELVTLRDDTPLPEPVEAFAVADPDPGTLLAFLDTMQFTTLGRRVREHFARTGAPAPEQAPAEIKIAEALQEPAIDFNAYETVDTLEKLSHWIARAQEAGFVGLAAQGDTHGTPRARLIGVSLALSANQACYIPLAHVRRSEPVGDLFAAPPPGELQPPTPEAVDAPAVQIPLDAAILALKPLLEDPTVLKIGHDVKRSRALLGRHGVRLAPFDDVMLISYALAGGLDEHDLESLSEQHLGHKPISFADVCGSGKGQIPFDRAPVAMAARYSAEDADITIRLWRRLKPRLARERVRTVYETLERPIAPVLGDMEEAGVRVDANVLSRLSGDFAQRMGALEDEAYKIAGKQFNMGSPKQIGDIFFGEMGLPGGRKTKTGAWSTDADVLEDLAAQGHALPRVLLDWRQLSKLRSTYTEALREAIDPKTARVHTTFQLAATTTGRLSSYDPNLQNIPIRTDEGRRIREAFIADPGAKLISADYSQIELRLLAHVADIPALKQAFMDGLDIHAMTASEMFSTPIEGMDPMIRRQAKAINFGIIYGISAFGLARNLGIERGVADAYIKQYFERFPGIRDYMERTKALARETGYVTTIFGRRCWAPGIKSRNPTERAYGERQAINAPLQGAAADIIRRAMVRVPAALAAAGLKTRMLLQVHDELVFEAPEAEVAEASALVKSVMEAAALPAVALSVPLTVEAKAGRTWAEAH